MSVSAPAVGKYNNLYTLENGLSRKVLTMREIQGQKAQDKKW